MGDVHDVAATQKKTLSLLSLSLIYLSLSPPHTSSHDPIAAVRALAHLLHLPKKGPRSRLAQTNLTTLKGTLLLFHAQEPFYPASSSPANSLFDFHQSGGGEIPRIYNIIL